MADIVTPKTRSRMMAGIKGKDTKPEILVRKNLHAKGFRYLLHDKRLPGSPDLVFPRHRAVIIINGCFWHGHGCKIFKWPTSNRAFWRNKISGNIKRDVRDIDRLKKDGWRIFVVWECAMKGSGRMTVDSMTGKIARWLCAGRRNAELKARNTRHQGRA